MSEKAMTKCDKCGDEYSVGDWPFCPHGSTHMHVPFDLVQCRRAIREPKADAGSEKAEAELNKKNEEK